MTLEEVAKGYTKRAQEVMSGAAAPAIRNEVKKYADIISATEGPTQYEHLGKLVKALDPYKSFFKDIWSDPEERSPFALALVNYEKSLH